MYTCGITPYDATHLGHAATFIVYDVLQRRLIDLGHTVKCVRNVTDVDDPLFAKARQLGVHYLDLAAGEEARFERDMEALNALPVSSTPRASSAIPDIRGFIGMVLDRGFAYQAGGSVYFDVSKFPSFGSISNYSHEQMIAFARERGGNVDDPHKRHPLDFVLWHPSAADEPSWDTMWGPGRPGWHIECSALALRELGTTIDLHGGGTDLIFPHHECERAQSEAATGEPFVRHWMHTAMVYMDGHEDVEEPRQPGVRRRAAQGVGPAGDPPGDHRAPLPARLGVGRHADAAQRRNAWRSWCDSGPWRRGARRRSRSARRRSRHAGCPGSDRRCRCRWSRRRRMQRRCSASTSDPARHTEFIGNSSARKPRVRPVVLSWRV